MAKNRIILSHHHPEQEERCFIFAGRHLCRRCFIIYPTALFVGIVFNTALPPVPESLAWFLVLILPAGATVEHLGELSGTLPYSKRRATILNVVMAFGIGVGLSALWGPQTNALFWVPLALYGIAWGVPWWTANME